MAGEGGGMGGGSERIASKLSSLVFLSTQVQGTAGEFFLQTASSFHDEGGSRRKPLLFSFMG